MLLVLLINPNGVVVGHDLDLLVLAGLEAIALQQLEGVDIVLDQPLPDPDRHLGFVELGSPLRLESGFGLLLDHLLVGLDGQLGVLDRYHLGQGLDQVPPLWDAEFLMQEKSPSLELTWANEASRSEELAENVLSSVLPRTKMHLTDVKNDLHPFQIGLFPFKSGLVDIQLVKIDVVEEEVPIRFCDTLKENMPLLEEAGEIQIFHLAILVWEDGLDVVIALGHSSL